MERCNWPSMLYFAGGARRVAHGNTFLFAEIITQLSSFTRQRHIGWKTHRRDSYFARTPSLCTQRRYHTTKHKLILNNKMQIECFIPRLVSSGPCRVPWSLVHLPLPAACTHRTTRNTEPRGNENRVKGKNPVVIKKWPKISAEGRKSPACSFYAANLDYVVRSRNGAI